ncbi:MAG: glycosyltransferase [Verrucomicrobiota bacterium]|nr:glycosyltransferase [Verrucomicrobiota bacterium]
MKSVSIVTVSFDTLFFARLLVEKVREFIGPREYEIIVVDRGSTDGTLEWCARQNDVRVVSFPQTQAQHRHAEAATAGIRSARGEVIALLDSDAHPIAPDWLGRTADRLDERCQLAGARYQANHRGNPFGWYVHPHFMVFARADFGDAIVLEKLRGATTDVGEEATIRVLERGREVLAWPLQSCGELPADHPYALFSFGHPHFPTIGAGVFHAWYGTRLQKDVATVAQETDSAISPLNYRQPLIAALRDFYQLDY